MRWNNSRAEEAGWAGRNAHWRIAQSSAGPTVGGCSRGAQFSLLLAMVGIPAHARGTGWPTCRDSAPHVQADLVQNPLLGMEELPATHARSQCGRCRLSTCSRRLTNIWRACCSWRNISVFDQFLSKAAELLGQLEPFAVAIVVCSTHRRFQGSRAISHIHSDGRVWGWVGGGCTEPVIVKEALLSLEDGRPRLVRISPAGPADRDS